MPQDNYIPPPSPRTMGNGKAGKVGVIPRWVAVCPILNISGSPFIARHQQNNLEQGHRINAMRPRFFQGAFCASTLDTLLCNRERQLFK